MKQIFTQFSSFSDLDPWIKRRTRLGDWHTKCRHIFVILSHSGNAGGEGSYSSFYRGLFYFKCADVLGETL